MSHSPSINISNRARNIAGLLLVVGAGTAIYGTIANPERVWPNLLLNGFYVITLGVSAMFFL
ncbi:MAG TPA: hypothetical protein VE133_10870, partial [Candidatus Sulfotelmatobacter sp.]|nr:hypothetical protein [Candidatus Sulfotelmatobacter sp.]